MSEKAHAAYGGGSRRRFLRRAGGLALVMAGAATAGCRNDDVPDAGKGADPSPPTGGTAAAPAEGGAPEPLWTKTTSARAIADGRALLAADGVVLATGRPLDAREVEDGSTRWSLADGSVPGAPLLLGGGTLYLASAEYDGSIVGFDPETGEETWRGRLGGEYRQPRPMAVDGTQVYVTAEILEDGSATGTNVIAALNCRTGKVVWKEQRDVGTEENGITATVQGRHLVYTDFRKNLTVRDTSTGGQVWTHRTTTTNYQGFAVHDDRVILAQGRSLQAFSLLDGARKWSLQTEKFDTFKAPTVLDGVLYVADSAKVLWAVDPRTGRTVWRSRDLAAAHAPVPWQFVKAGGTVYGAAELDQGGGIHAFDPKTGALRWTFNDKTGDLSKWHVAADGKHVIALHGKKLHCLPAQTT